VVVWNCNSFSFECGENEGKEIDRVCSMLMIATCCFYREGVVIYYYQFVCNIQQKISLKNCMQQPKFMPSNFLG
jgi:hypothetical protein